MSKVIKIAAGTLVVGAVAFFGSTYYVSKQLNKNIDTIVSSVNTKFSESNLPLTIEISDVSASFFNTSAVLNLKTNDKVLARLDTKASHGPFVGFPKLGLAKIEATLTDDKGLQSIIDYSKSPMQLALDGTVGFNGGFNLALAVSPLDKDVLTGKLTSGNLNALFVYEPHSTLNWQLSTPKLTFSESIGTSASDSAYNSFTLDMFVLKGQLGFTQDSSKPNSALYHLSVDKGVVTNAVMPELSAEFNKLMLSSTLADNKSNQLLLDAAYQLQLDALKVGKVALDGILLDAKIGKMPKESLLINSSVGAEMSYIPLILKQSVLMNNQSILNYEPTFSINALNLANSAGKMTFSTDWTLRTAKNDQPSESVADLFVKEMNMNLMLDKAFATQMISQVQQMNSKMSEEEANKAAESMLGMFIDLSQLNGELFDVQEKQILLNATLKDDKGMLNGQAVEDSRIYDLISSSLNFL
ncbi:DUF945 family protein [Thorsellia kenyensis]|uniref:DUF945 family protein n=1 Tax=Thorsellia kenyensis TaxID=1549888 RepID=A0ABV6C9T2_9GAMM